MGEIQVRPIRRREWRKVKDIRLRSLRDESASIAFLDDYATAAARPDQFWRERADVASADGSDTRQFVAATEDGTWVGTLTVTLEHGDAVVVGVYLDPAFRGQQLLRRMFDAAFEWARSRGAARARLRVHSENARARAAYANLGFRNAGASIQPSGLKFWMQRDLRHES